MNRLPVEPKNACILVKVAHGFSHFKSELLLLNNIDLLPLYIVDQERCFVDCIGAVKEIYCPNLLCLSSMSVRSKQHCVLNGFNRY